MICYSVQPSNSNWRLVTSMKVVVLKGKKWESIQWSVHFIDVWKSHNKLIMLHNLFLLENKIKNSTKSQCPIFLFDQRLGLENAHALNQESN